MATAPMKESSEEGKKRIKFSYEEDMELLRLVYKHEPYNAAHGSVSEKWEQIRSELCSNHEKQFTARACKDRFGILMQSGFRFKEVPTTQMIEESSRLMHIIRHRVDEVKFKGKGKLERPSMEVVVNHEAVEETNPPAHNTGSSEIGLASPDINMFFRLLEGQLRLNAQMLDDAKEERQLKRQKLEFEQRRFEQEMSFRIQEAERRDRRDAEERVQRREEFRLLMELVKESLTK
ncbi:hypothetical protein THRCLA_04998 [Thraustotheca clavata]|uniref:Myb-like domain-containing protein n=1 Tax=Thraustotheca clavata TaxID=74557 RepID=A0A1V9ZX99_9STRA|nr:hypothetical protein THRCLA_04998 [Thraustotheca clavata]